MIQLIRHLWSKFRELVLYGIIGVFSSSLDYAVFTLLTAGAGIHYLPANSCSVLVGIGTSFTLNRSINFKVKDKTVQRFLIFLSIGMGGLCLSNVILWVAINRFHAAESISKLFSIAAVVAIQFTLNKLITFRQAA